MHSFKSWHKKRCSPGSPKQQDGTEKRGVTEMKGERQWEEWGGRHPAGSKTKWQSDRWRGLARVCICVCPCVQKQTNERRALGGSPVPLMSWQVGPPPPATPTSGPTPRAQPPPPQSPHSTQQFLLFHLRVQSGQCSSLMLPSMDGCVAA